MDILILNVINYAFSEKRAFLCSFIVDIAFPGFNLNLPLVVSDFPLFLFKEFLMYLNYAKHLSDEQRIFFY